jgi:hypothetical protein
MALAERYDPNHSYDYIISLLGITETTPLSVYEKNRSAIEALM